jgi:hypothetical protein
MSHTGFGSPSRRALKVSPTREGIAVCPGRLDERPPGAPVAGQGKALPPDRVAGRALCWNEAQERHQLSSRIEPSHVSNLRREGHGDEKRSAARRLVCLHDGRHGPLGRDEGELLLEATQSLKRVFDRIDPFLKDNLLRDVFELLAGEPASVRSCKYGCDAAGRKATAGACGEGRPPPPRGTSQDPAPLHVPRPAP